MRIENKELGYRYRPKTVAFRTTDEEWDLLNLKVKLSGMSKQAYLASCFINHQVVVNPNPYVANQLKHLLKEFIQKFDQVHSLGDVDLATLEALDVVLTIIRGLIDES